MRSVDSEVEAMDRPGPANWFSESSAIAASLNFNYLGVGTIGTQHDESVTSTLI